MPEPGLFTERQVTASTADAIAMSRCMERNDMQGGAELFASRSPVEQLLITVCLAGLLSEMVAGRPEAWDWLMSFSTPGEPG